MTDIYLKKIKSKYSIMKTPYTVGQWMPSDQEHIENWKTSLITETHNNPKPLLPIIQKLKGFIEEDAQVFMLFSQMFNKIPKNNQFKDSPTENPQVKNYQHMLELLNALMTK